MRVNARVSQNSNRVSAITIGESGASSISALRDVTLTSPLSDGSFLIYDTASSRWKNQTLSGGITVTNTGSVSVNYPQAISTSSSPTFAGLTINGPQSINGALNVNQGLSLSPALSSTSATLGSKSFYVNTGGNVTWTLPTIASSLGKVYFIKNRGSGTITLIPSGSDSIFFTSAVSSLSISPGEAYIVASDGSSWQVM